MWCHWTVFDTWGSSSPSRAAFGDAFAEESRILYAWTHLATIYSKYTALYKGCYIHILYFFKNIILLFYIIVHSFAWKIRIAPRTITSICFLVVQLITGYFPVFTERSLVRMSYPRSKAKQKTSLAPPPQYSHSIQSLRMNKVLSFFKISRQSVQTKVTNKSLKVKTNILHLIYWCFSVTMQYFIS